MKRWLIGLVLGVISLGMFGCGSDDNNNWLLFANNNNVTLKATVNGQTTTTVTTGDVATLTATVLTGGAPVPTGTEVTFAFGATPFGTATTDSKGVASVTNTIPASVPAGDYTVTASTKSYGSGSLKITVINPTDPKTIALAADKTSVTQGDNVTFTAEVKDGQNPAQPVKNATVTFTFGTTATAVTDDNGIATKTMAATTLGTMNATATLGKITSPVVAVTVKAPVVVGTVSLVAHPASIPGDNTSTSTLDATVKMSDGSDAPDGTTVNFTTTDSKLTLSAASATTTGGTATVTVKAGSTTAGSATVKASVGEKSGSATVSYTAFTKPTKAVVTISAVDAQATGTKIGGITVEVKSPTGVVIEMDPDPTNGVLLTNTPTGALAAGGYTAATNTARVAITKATGFAAGTVFTLTYDIPANVATPAASDFVSTLINVGSTSGATIPGMTIAQNVVFQ